MKYCCFSFIAVFLCIRLAFSDAYTDAPAPYHFGMRIKDTNPTVAIKAFTDALKAQPNFWEGYYERGATYFRIRDFANAEKDLTVYIDNGSSYFAAYHYRGLSRLHLEKNELAVKDLSQTIVLIKSGAFNDKFPQHLLNRVLSDSLSLRSSVFVINGRISEACNDFIEGKKLGPHGWDHEPDWNKQIRKYGCK